MARDAAITLDFGDGTYRFRLGYGELMELQEALDAGPWYLLAQFSGLATMMLNPVAIKGLSVKALREVIRIGLIGGGMKPGEALRLVRLYVEARPPDECVNTAYQVLLAALSGAPDADEAKKKAGDNPSGLMTSPAESSGSPASLEPEPPSE